MNFWLCDWRDWASVTISIMRCRVLSAARWVTSRIKRPLPLTVPLKTSSPTSFQTGMLSPVTGAWLMSLSPSMTSPSIGIRSPGRTKIRSPTANSSTGTRVSCPSSTLRAWVGVREVNPERVRRARALVKPSSASARSNNKINAAASAYSPITTAPIPATVIKKLILNVWLIHRVIKPLRAIGHPANRSAAICMPITSHEGAPSELSISESSTMAPAAKASWVSSCPRRYRQKPTSALGSSSGGISDDSPSSTP